MTDPGRWRRLFFAGKRNVSAEVDDELRFHLEMKTQQLIAQGVDPATARERAAALFGVVDDVRDSCVAIDQRKQRRHRRGDIMTALSQDVQYAWRSMRSTPGFTAIVAITLAIGIGANTAIFSVVDGVLLKPLAYSDPERLVAFVDVQRGNEAPVSVAEFLSWREGTGHEKVFTDVAALFRSSAVLTGDGEPLSLTGARMSWSLPRLLGTTPVAGRAFLPEDDPHTAPRVVIISERLWRKRYDGSPSAIGRAITLNGNPYTIIGVFPVHARTALPFGYVSAATLDFWLPMRLDPAQESLRGLHFMSVVGRLRPGATLTQARAFLDRQVALAQTAGTTTNDARVDPLDETHGARVEPLDERILGGVASYLAVLLGAVAFVLLIACVNVANLLLARAATRQREIAIRMAIGAGRARVVSQLLIESVMRALLGGALGVAVAYGALAAFQRYLPTRLPRFNEVTIDTRVLAFLLVVSVVTGVLFGLVPALRSSRVDLVTSLREGGRGLFGSITRDRLRRTLVMAEVALSFVLLVGAGLLARSLQQMFAVPRGFAVDGAMTAWISLSSARYAEPERQAAFFEQAVARLSALPGVRGVTATSNLPVEGGTSGGVGIEGVVFGPNERPYAEKRIVATNYFDVLGARLARGRGFESTDRAGGEPVVVVNETFVLRYLPDGPAVGRRVEFLWGTTGAQTIVGVVADIREQDLNEPAAPAIYIPMTQRPADGAYLIVATAGDVSSHLSAVRREILALDPNLPLANVRTMDQVIADRHSRERFATALLGVFSFLALLLAAIGVYGVISYGVAQRTAEIGVRTALGAQSRDIVRLVLLQAMTLVAAGVILGIGGALLATRALRAELFGVQPTDAATFASAAFVLVITAFAASAIPSWRATRVDPLTALRHD